MAKTLLVTGSTGLVGSNVCRLARQRGYDVRALVRNKKDGEPLSEFGVELVSGDITNLQTLEPVMKGVTHVVHTAAVLGGTWAKATAEEITTANRDGAINVLTAAERAGVERTIMFSSVAICDWNETLTERSHILPIGAEASPYAKAKVATYYESMARAARGQFVATVIPGGIYGPSPILDRALASTSVNWTLIEAATGRLKRYLPIKMPWVFAEDAANIALNALEKGRSGARYLAAGKVEDACSYPAFCNKFSAMAGSAHRVEEFDATAPGAEHDADYGNMIRYVLQKQPEPLFDSTTTLQDLAFTPTSTDKGLTKTLAWLRENGKLA